ncbi:tetratricopeptide repeat-containing glycosyltransferase [Acinetobacter ihumii]|uniref:tetratricopeptide repeat-containing glycosyltransferase n=1 Tax=Acinetobacter ihumii TaxID=2483802 RepID=UPI00103185BE|nr:glycosyltransferase [Acinetobacter ihumii]
MKQLNYGSENNSSNLQSNPKKKVHIRLNMIVKNEAHVILRCLQSVKPWIDSWVIVDTGSTDGTQDIINNFLSDIPGQLFERSWKNFGFNRTEALQLATTWDNQRSDYLLFIDADETLLVDENFKLPDLNETAYYFKVNYGNLSYRRNALVSTKLSWQWKGVLHEYLDSPQKHNWHTLEGLTIFVRHDGARAKTPDTYLKDITLLEQGLKDEPDNLRYIFYLAQSYRDAKILDKSRNFYLERSNKGGWEEERWMAQFRAAQMAERLGLAHDIVYTEYLQSWIARQQRAEPLYELARYYRSLKSYDLACYYADQAVNIERPEDRLFVDASVYDWRALDELSVSATYCKAYREKGKLAIHKLVEQRKYPQNQHERIMGNLKLYC